MKKHSQSDYTNVNIAKRCLCATAPDNSCYELREPLFRVRI